MGDGYVTGRSTEAPPACGHASPVHARAQRGAAAPCGAPRHQGWSGAARLVLGLDPRRRMGEGRTTGVPWGEDLGKDGWGSSDFKRLEV